MTIYQPYDTNYLKHYGVIGMKWGVRKNPTRALEKSSRKMDKLNKKKNRLLEKSSTASMHASQAHAKSEHMKLKQSKDDYRQLKGSMFAKSERAKQKLNMQAADAQAKYDKANKKADKAYKDYNKAYKKSQKWEKQMTKTFSKISYDDIDQASIDSGRKYLYMLNY